MMGSEFKMEYVWWARIIHVSLWHVCVFVCVCNNYVCVCVCVCVTTIQASGDIQRVRQGQSKKWLWSHINWELVKRFRMQPGLDEQIAEMEKMVVAGSLPAGSAAEILLDKFFAVRNTNAGQSRAPNCATMELNELLDQPPTAR